MNAYDVMLSKGIAYRKTVHVIEESLEPLGLTTAEWLCLGTVASGRFIGGEIAQILGVSKGMASRHLSTLGEKGYVHEATARDDTRQRLYTITAKGSNILKKADDITKNSLREWLQDIDADHVRIYILVLQKVSQL